MTRTRSPLAGSERHLPRGARRLPGASQDRFQISVRLRPRAPEALRRFVDRLLRQTPSRRRHLTREQFAERFGARLADVAALERFAHSHSLTVARVDRATRTVRLEGTARAFAAAFEVRLTRVRTSKGTYRMRSGAIHLPRALREIVVGVHGLDNRPVARPHLRHPRQSRQFRGTFTAPEVGKLYGFPRGLDGRGQCVALIELNELGSRGKPKGAGYTQSDLKAYFKKLGMPLPAISAIGVNGGANLPGHSSFDGEVTLDVQVAAAIAPAAAIAVYFTPNTSDGFIDAVKAAVHDTVRRPSVISISWGGPEDVREEVSKQMLDGVQEALLEAAALGITVCVSAGDSGSADMGSDWDHKPHADFPASSPYALACGGTHLTTRRGGIHAETVWNTGPKGGAGGGGISTVFARPFYQRRLAAPRAAKGFRGRALPDVAGNAAPASGYRVYVGGRWRVIGGTSAVAPLMAGLIACLNQRLQRRGQSLAGCLNGALYAADGASCRDITVGNNDLYGTMHGTYSAAVGWDACSGWGVPIGKRLLQLLQQ